MMSYPSDLATLQSAVTHAERRHAADLDWLLAGPDVSHCARGLARAAAESEAALERARLELRAYLQCTGPSNHAGLGFYPDGAGQWACYCPDCLDLECTVGRGDTQADAFADYWERSADAGYC